MTGNNVYIAPRVCSVSNNNIGSNVCVGAGAIITKDLLTGNIYAGNPAKLIGENKHPEYIGIHILYPLSRRMTSLISQFECNE